MEVFPAPRKPVKIVIGIVEEVSELEGMIEGVNRDARPCRAAVSVSVSEGVNEWRGVLGAFHSEEGTRITCACLLGLAYLGLASIVPMPPTVLLTIRASWLARLHTVLSLAAFTGALAIASSLHFTKIVRNAIAGWPEEWFPSVSAT